MSVLAEITEDLSHDAGDRVNVSTYIVNVSTRIVNVSPNTHSSFSFKPPRALKFITLQL